MPLQKFCRTVAVRRHFRPRLNLIPLHVEEQWDRNHGNAEKFQKAGGPGDAHLVIHCRPKEQDTGPEEAVHERIGAVGYVEVHVYELLEALHKDHEHTHTHRIATDHHASPRHTRFVGPREGEEVDGQNAAADKHER